MFREMIKETKGFTLVEVMIVVAIIGVLASMAVPNFMRSRQAAQEAACIANLRTIYGAVNLAVLDNALGDREDMSTNPGWDYNIWSSDPEVGLVTRYLNARPYCPFGPRSEQDSHARYYAIPDGDSLYVVCDYYNARYHRVEPQGRTRSDFFDDHN